MTATIREPGRIEPPAGEIPHLLLPDRKEYFARVAARLDTLAADHPLGDFLRFAARISEAQQQALAAFSTVALPDDERLAVCREHGMPPLAATGWRRDPAWREGLRHLLDGLEVSASGPGRGVIERLLQADDRDLEAMADALLAGDYAGLDLAAASVVGAALQVYWLQLAGGIGVEGFARTGINYLCPVCGSPPVASVVKGGAGQGLRYLHCSLCASEWHMVRAQCSNCESAKAIAYQEVEGALPGVKAETCEECGSYLKIMFPEQDPGLEPVADDLASLALDILLAETGIRRSGPNLLLLPGKGSDPGIGTS